MPKTKKSSKKSSKEQNEKKESSKKSNEKVKRKGHAKLASQGAKIMKRAQEIRVSQPGKAWNSCVSLASKELKEKKEL
jgi:hypothetical protein